MTHTRLRASEVREGDRIRDDYGTMVEVVAAGTRGGRVDLHLLVPENVYTYHPDETLTVSRREDAS